MVPVPYARPLATMDCDQLMDLVVIGLSVWNNIGGKR